MSDAATTTSATDTGDEAGKTGATPGQAGDTGATPEAAEAALGDAGKQLLSRLRSELKDANARIREFEQAKPRDAADEKPKPTKTDDDPVKAVRDEIAAIKAELDQQKSRAEEAEQRNAFTAAARAEGVRAEAIDDLFAVVKTSGADLSDPASVITGLRETKPFYFGAARKTGGADGAAGNGGGAGPELTADEVKFAKMFGIKPDEYAQNK